MAGGYRCSHGHTWTPPDGSAAASCPVCGDTTLTGDAADPVFVYTGGTAGTDGQGATQSLAVPQLAAVSPDHAVTRVFVAPPPGAPAARPDPADPSFSSLVVLGPDASTPSARGTAASSVVPFGRGDDAEHAPPLVPGYEILHEVGRGGMGVVYKARHLRLNRTVALKMILSGAHAGPSERERFRREAEAVAALQHPHIVQIFDIGEASGHPYLALEFVDGGSLAANLTGAPWESKRAAAVVEVLARTMQFAHDAGIVHRDLKPGNILLAKEDARRATDDGKKGSSVGLPGVPPKVTDFGLAKRLDETLGGDGTRTGAVMGTPSYIAPEQASGRAREVGPAADVYALGAILYELLTGRPPFRGETPLDTVLQVVNDDPVPPKRLHPLVPRDLETICLKCLEKHPVKRYAGAAALADDLRRFLHGEPIAARPLSAWGRGAKWTRRHPALAVLLGMTVTATVALVAVLSVSYARVRDAVSAKEAEARVAQQERDGAEAEKRHVEELNAELVRKRQEAVEQTRELQRQVERSRRAAYALQLSQVAILCDRDPQRAAALLDDEARCPPDLRDFTWHYLRRLSRRDDRAYLDHGGDPLRAVAYSPTGAFVATAGDAGSIRLWDPRTGRTWLTLVGHAGAVRGLAFSPDGTAVASAGADGTVRLWVLPVEVLATARRAVTLLPWLRALFDPIVRVSVVSPAVTLAAAHAPEVTCVAFRPDGRALVSGGADGRLRWWDLSGWQAAGPDAAALGGAGAAAGTLARAARAPDARPVWGLTEPLDAHEGGVLCLAFAPGGAFLVSGGRDRHPIVWAADGGRRLRTLPAHADAVRAVAVTPDGNTVATADNPAADDGRQPTVRLFDARTWRDRRRLIGHTRTIYALAASEDGQLLASAGFDRTVRLWDPDDGAERGHLVGHTEAVNALAFAPDRRTVVSVGHDGAAVVWQTAARTHEPEDVLQYMNAEPQVRIPAQQLLAAGVGGRGAAFVVGDDLGRVRMFAADYAPANRPAPTGPLALRPLRFTPAPGRVEARAAAASPDGRYFVVAGETGLLVWHAPPLNSPFQGTRVRPVVVRTPAPVRALAIDPTGRWLAAADAEAVRLYDLRAVPAVYDRPVDLKGGRVLAAAPGAGEVAFHPTRDLLAVAVGTGVRVVTFRGERAGDAPGAHGKAAVEAVAFDQTGDGDLLATGDASGLIKLWAVEPSGKLTFLRDLTGHTGAVSALAFSSSGRTLASGGDDRLVILWDPVAGQERLSLSGHADRVMRVAFNRDGTALVTVGRDGAVKRWRADPRPVPEGGMRMQRMTPETMP